MTLETPDTPLTAWDGVACTEWAKRHNLPLFEAHAVIGSTNARLRELAGQGAEPFSVVVANAQTSGRGRAGKTWVSPPGGLWFSVLLRPEEGPLSRLTPLVAGLAVSRAVKHVTGVTTSLKWPNDVLIGSGKLAGILCEAVPADFVVTGVGINLRTPESGWPSTLVEHPTALADHLESPLPGIRSALLGGVLSELDTILRFDSVEAFLKAWSKLDALRGREVVCSMGAEGTAQGIGADGGLQVRTSEGLVVIRSGSVRLRSESGSGNPEQAVPQ